jgi:serine/threonine-protein kinase
MFDERSAKSRIGEAIGGKFRLEKLIGVGAMGAVYQALHEWTQRRVAVKLLFDEGDRASSTEAIERFFREARAATKIGHRNIVEVLDTGQHSDGTYYLVLELLEGETLRQRLDRLGRLSLTEAFELLLPVMDALSAAHAAGVVHRDVKPENILLHAERKTTRAAKLVPKLIDFGVAKTSAQRSSSIRGRSSLTISRTSARVRSTAASTSSRFAAIARGSFSNRSLVKRSEYPIAAIS